ncbi:hypothetical protein [Luteibaculum oceani]|uniref:WD40 repeat domain-containing protein n=1 Tax=Luteibaculum oceani TaxID=1294296 RepID=A0A5C6VAX3_9FLAO|nr:hypothetical protein [Luteibaculum oceani]TXC81536.1 hypothetical protein FRX97_05880 [Luteibaculum oceani]
METIYLKDFKVDHSFYGEIDLGATIKSFNLDEIRKRYIASQSNKSGRSGSVERRPAGLGGIAQLKLAGGKLVESEILTKVKEPRGIDFKAPFAAVSSENTIYLLDEIGNAQEIKNPWFSYIHTVNFNDEGTEVLVSSSGFDCLFTYKIKELSKAEFEWFAWENGFNTGKNPSDGSSFLLTRDEAFSSDGLPVKLIKDPISQVLPTAMRAAFINSSEWDGGDHFLITMFHRGEVRKIDRKNPTKSEIVFTGLVKPHGGKRIEENTYMATNTGGGAVWLRKGETLKQFVFDGIPGKHDGLEKLEWIQNSVYLPSKEVFIAIDSNRTSLVVFNPDKKLIDLIAYPDHWALQDINLGRFSAAQKERLLSISSE